jgi:hypothetical protein
MCDALSVLSYAFAMARWRLEYNLLIIGLPTFYHAKDGCNLSGAV